MNGAPPPPASGAGAGAARGPSPTIDWVATPPPVGVLPGTPGSWGGPGWAPGPWTPPGAGWPSPGPPPHLRPARPASGDRRRLTLVAVAAAVGGAAIAALVVSLVFLAGARQMGQAMGEAMGEEIGDRMAEELGFGTGWPTDPLVEPLPSGPVEQTAPVAPVDLGPDPVLDAYAQQCFDGDLQSCDDLYYSSPPGSGYEQYGTSCGGRVAAGAVWACTELD